jgi:hypothetical protein
MTTVVKRVRDCAHQHPSSVAVGLVIALPSTYLLITCKSAIASIAHFDIKTRHSSTLGGGALSTSKSQSILGLYLPVCKPGMSVRHNAALSASLSSVLARHDSYKYTVVAFGDLRFQHTCRRIKHLDEYLLTDKKKSNLH